jgi:hypothetical protein
VNQGKRRLNQSLRFVRAAPLNLRDCATSDPSLSSSLAIITVVNGLGTKLNTKFTSVNSSLK